MKLRFKQAWPVLLLLALVVIFLGDILFGGRMFFFRDFWFGDVGLRVMHGKALLHGSFGLWWSASQCGVPGAAQPYDAAFYPPNWIFVLPSVEWAIRLLWAFHLAVAALGWYALARYWRLAVAPALFAAVSFAFSTQVFTWMESQAVTGMVWGPLVLLLVSRIIDRTAERSDSGFKGLLFYNAGGVAALAVVMTLQMLATGEHFYYTVLIAGFYGVARWVWFRSWNVCVYSALLLASAGLLGLALAMPQLLLTAELLPLSDRAGEYNAFLDIASVHPRHWLTVFLPFLYGKPGYPAAYWGPKMHEFAAGHCYVGIAPLVAACFCWLWLKGGEATRERRFQIGFFIVLGIVGLVMAAGKFTPVYPFLHHWLPGLGHLRFAPKFYLFVAYALTMLGALGFQALVEGDSKTANPSHIRLWWIATGCFSVLICGYLVCLFSSNFLPWLMAHPGMPSVEQVNAAMFDYTWAVAFSLAALGLLGMLVFKRGPARWVQGGIVALAFVNLLLISRQVQPTMEAGIYTKRPEVLAQKIREHPTDRFLSMYSRSQQYFYGETRSEMLDWVVSSGATGASRLEGIYTLMPGGVALERYNQLFGIMSDAPQPISDKIADMMSLRYVASGAPFDQILWANASRDIKLIERPTCLPRARVVSKWRFVTGDVNVLKTIVGEGFDPRKEAVLEPLPGGAPVLSGTTFASTGEAAGDVSSFVDHTDSVTMQVSTKSRSLLVLGDTWYPGWIARVDGMQQPIFRANYYFRGVFLEPGTHWVEFAYQPVRFTIGVWIFAFAAAACGGLVWMSRRSEPRHRRYRGEHKNQGAGVESGVERLKQRKLQIRPRNR